MPPPVSENPSFLSRTAGHQPEAKVFILHDGDAYGERLAQLLANAMGARGLNLLESQNVEKVLSYDSVIDKVVDRAPAVVVFAGYSEPGRKLIQRLIERSRYAGPVVLTDGCFKPENADLFKAARHGVYATFFLPDPANVPNLALTARNRDPYFLLGGDSICLIHQAAGKVANKQLPLNRRTLLQALSPPSSFRQDLFVAGNYRFNDAHDNQLGKIYVFELQSGAGTPRWKLFWNSSGRAP
jgi:ABC-type branched-subunit amino acid transport system substrate-binding protein